MLFENYKKKYEESQSQLRESENERITLSAQLSSAQDELIRSKQEQKSLLSECERLKAILGPDEQRLISARILVNDLQHECDDLSQKKDECRTDYEDMSRKLDALREEYVTLEDAVLLQSFALYKPQYKFATSDIYKSRLNAIRERQADMIRDKRAAICSRVWSLEGSTAKGHKFEEDNIKQILRSFNVECDDLIQRVKFNNFEASQKRIKKAFNQLNKLNEVNMISITKAYLDLKLEELTLAFEFALKKQEEKEELKRQRELHKEELKLAKEIEEKRADIEKEQQHYNHALQRINDQISGEKNADQLEILLQRREEISARLIDLDTAMKDIDYREANHRAGYVYVISNIGSFGDDIYKIGMTRRLEPLDRIDELGGASVPFKFDVHALIFSDDAPGLEAALHREFEDKKVNAVNGRKEFFHVTLKEIEAVVKKYHDATVEFSYLPEAQQYRESLLIRKEQENG